MQTGQDYGNLVKGLITIGKTNFSHLSHGWAPTAIGYSLQGLNKFGLYELFKHYYAKAAGPERLNKYSSLRTVLYMSASASAEFFADIFLCPFEAIKVRIQTSPEGTFPTNMRQGMPKMFKEGGFAGLYKGLIPLWTRQIPYTIIKLFVDMMYKRIFTKGRDNYTKTQQLGVSFLGGYMAGIFCAICSHPPDVVVSKLYKSPDRGMMEIARELGWSGKNLFFLTKKGMWSGLGARIFMIGTLTALQWYIFDAFKTYNNFPTTGGRKFEKKK